MTLHQQLKDAFESISEDYRSERGICQHLPPDTREIFKDLCKRWPEYSGDLLFPVPHHFLDPFEAYYKTSPEEMWNPEHPYGAARWRLIRFCIEELSK